MNPAKRRAIFERLRAANPDPTTELAHSTPFELLVSVVLSAQATDKGVNRATERLYRVANTAAAMAKLGVEGLIPYISSIGLYRNKAKNVVALSEMLLREHGGEVPHDREALERLPGVGRKSANVVLNVAFGEPTIAVDTHIFRVCNRTGLAPGKDPLEVERKLNKVVEDEFRHNAHHWLILHGRYTCVARVPKCPECVILDLCEFTRKTRLVAPEAVDRMLVKPAPKARVRATDASKSAAARKGGAGTPAVAGRRSTKRPSRVIEPVRPPGVRKARGR